MKAHTSGVKLFIASIADHSFFWHDYLYTFYPLRTDAIISAAIFIPYIRHIIFIIPYVFLIAAQVFSYMFGYTLLKPCVDIQRVFIQEFFDQQIAFVGVIVDYF